MPTSAAAAKKATLENKFLRVEVLREFGGKITSLFDKLSATEFLLQPTRDYIHADQDTPFEQSDRSGWDECLPTISATIDTSDHGDLWRKPWKIDLDDPVIHSCDCISRPLRLSRFLSLNSYTLRVSYNIQNLSEHDVYFLWSAHPLLAVSPGDRIVLPSSVDQVRVDSSRNHHLPGKTASWPRSGSYDLSTVPECHAATADKLFVGPLGSRACGLYRAAEHAGIIFRSLFPQDPIRYTGLWLCYGGWPEDAVGTSAAQYAVAIEPTTSPFDSLDNAITHGTALRVGAHSSHDCGMQIAVFNGTLERFIECCNRED